MMQVIKYPPKETWTQLLKRPSHNLSSIKQKVQPIINEVKQSGDAAIKKFTKQFDNIELNNFQVNNSEWLAAETIDKPLKDAINNTLKNITTFHKSQIETIKKVETMPGISCWRKSVAIEKVGLYIPGGTAPLFSTLIMLAVPAVLAGCKEIIVCTPPQKDGSVHPAILYTAKQIGVSKIYKIGGAQAIAAMAFGTQTIPRVYKIFGPGNNYVTCAKMLLATEGIAIDMPAGPSEVAVIADEKANPKFIAADLLSQAEHGKDSQVLLVTDNESIIINTVKNIDFQLEDLDRKDIAEAALQNSKALLVKDIDEAVELINKYAPEHLIIACKTAEIVAEKIINAGSVFLGNHSPESVGDYASGTNHTLPTNGFSKAYSGVSVDSFVKKITFQQLSEQGLQSIAITVINMADAEGLQAHANAVKIRLNDEDESV